MVLFYIHLLFSLIGGHELLDLGDCLARVEALGTRARAVHDRVAPVEREGILHLLAALTAKLVAAVGHPAIRLQENGGAKVLVLIPPIARTRRAAAGAQNALVQPILSTKV